MVEAALILMRPVLENVAGKKQETSYHWFKAVIYIGTDLQGISKCLEVLANKEC